ncbi:MAG: hypothetical protein KAS13_07980 [Candidatus Omnitrophica bacterium]|nr:hypothetical protein [Candidatus Omnitrophota bacterium]
MIDYNRFKEVLIFAGMEECPILVEIQTDRVVKAFVRGKWISTKYYTIWQEYYDAQKIMREERVNQQTRRIL